jgi:hypothetical protein
MTDNEDIGLGLQYAAENRRAEIALLWSRSLYFWGLITVLLVAFGASYQSGHKTLATFAACFGVLCSLSWSLANRSSKYWQEVWEKKTEEWEALAVGRGVLHQTLFGRETNPAVDERWFWGAKQYSPSKLVMAISDFSVVGWILLVIGIIISRLMPESAASHVVAAVIGTIAVLATTFIAGIALLFWCRSGASVSCQTASDVLRRSPRRVVDWLANLCPK